MSGWIKRLRQKIRNRRPALILASITLIVLVSASVILFTTAQEVLAPQKWQVVIQKKYIAGPIIEEKYEYSAAEIEQAMATFSNMKKVENEDGSIIIEQEIDDLSPALKENGRFALDQNGMLNLYQGEAKDENIIQTFFQIDLERLETTLPVEEYMQLREGIHVSTLAEYNSVLSTYSEYAVMSHDDEGIEEH